MFAKRLSIPSQVSHKEHDTYIGKNLALFIACSSILPAASALLVIRDSLSSSSSPSNDASDAVKNGVQGVMGERLEALDAGEYGCCSAVAVAYGCEPTDDREGVGRKGGGTCLRDFPSGDEYLSELGLGLGLITGVRPIISTLFAPLLCLSTLGLEVEAAMDALELSEERECASDATSSTDTRVLRPC